MNSGKDDIKGVKKDIGILKEVIDEIQEDTTDMRLRMERLEKGQEKIMGALDHIVSRLETHKQEDAATTLLIDNHERRITRLEAAVA